MFGCRVVSCGVAECPPHFDLEEGTFGLEPANSLSPVFALLVFKSFPRPWRKLPVRTGSTLPHAPGGTAALRIDSAFSGDCWSTLPVKNCFNGVCVPFA